MEVNRRNFLQRAFSMLAAIPVLGKLALPKESAAHRDSLLSGATANNEHPIEFGSQMYLWLPISEHYVCRYCGLRSVSDGPYERMDHSQHSDTCQRKHQGSTTLSAFGEREDRGGRWRAGSCRSELEGTPSGSEYDMIDWPVIPRDWAFPEIPLSFKPRACPYSFTGGNVPWTGKPDGI